ncbi:MAG: hypothetical protein ACRELY_01545 [Polyangiaceae bacterium]
MAEPNPYAPPAVTIDTRSSDLPLPSGMRRFRLDPERYDRFQRIVMVQMMAIVTPIFTMLLLVNVWLFRFPPSYAVLADVLLVAWIGVARTIRIRMARKANLDTYELLVSERAVRRNLGGWTSAEILRPEVARITEVRTGLWIQCNIPLRSLFVASAIDDYASAREMFSRWAPIETMTGFSAWRMARREGKRQGLRDETFGTALAVDPSLVMELEMVRSASTTPEGTKSLSRGRAQIQLLVIWFALVFVFLAVWQFLSPSGPR